MSGTPHTSCEFRGDKRLCERREEVFSMQKTHSCWTEWGLLESSFVQDGPKTQSLGDNKVLGEFKKSRLSTVEVGKGKEDARTVPAETGLQVSAGGESRQGAGGTVREAKEIWVRENHKAADGQRLGKTTKSSVQVHCALSGLHWWNKPGNCHAPQCYQCPWQDQYSFRCLFQKFNVTVYWVSPVGMLCLDCKALKNIPIDCQYSKLKKFHMEIWILEFLKNHLSCHQASRPHLLPSVSCHPYRVAVFSRANFLPLLRRQYPYTGSFSVCASC